MDLSTLLDEMRKKVDDRKLMLPEMGYLLKGSVVFLHQKLVPSFSYYIKIFYWLLSNYLYCDFYSLSENLRSVYMKVDMESFLKTIRGSRNIEDLKPKPRKRNSISHQEGKNWLLLFFYNRV